MNNMILQLQTSAAEVYVSPLKDGLTKYKKELIKVGQYKHPSTKQAFEVTLDTLNYWVATFNRYLNEGSKVPIPLGHARDNMPEANAGWVTGMFVEGTSLFGVMELNDTDLALTTDVSICIEAEIEDSLGHKYKDIITHVALTAHPAIVGLHEFEKLSLSIGENMNFLKKIAEKLGLKESEVTEESVLLAVEPAKTGDKTTITDLSVTKPGNMDKPDPLMEMISENRKLKLSQMVQAGILTPAVRDMIVKQYADPKLTLSTETDGFELIYKVLLENRPVRLEVITGIQSVELANPSVTPTNAMTVNITKRRKEAGLDV